MALFKDLTKFGLGKYENTKILAEDKNKKNGDNENQEAEVKKEEDFLFDKHYECPVCGYEFTAKCMKVGKVKAEGKDTDLKPIYGEIDPLKYDAITCDRCGYSSITRYYGKVTTRQCKLIKGEIGANFSGINNRLEKYSYDDAIERHKLAVITTIVKGSSNSERAYTCLKLAWIIRSKRKSLPKEEIQQIKELYEDEMECLQSVYDGFITAMANEAFPIAGMDENTYMYILSDIARKLKRYDEAAKLIGTVITSRGASSRLKDEALKLKELIKKDMKEEAARAAAQTSTVANKLTN